MSTTASNDVCLIHCESWAPLVVAALWQFLCQAQSLLVLHKSATQVKVAEIRALTARATLLYLGRSDHGSVQVAKSFVCVVRIPGIWYCEHAGYWYAFNCITVLLF